MFDHPAIFLPAISVVGVLSELYGSSSRHMTIAVPALWKFMLQDRQANCDTCWQHKTETNSKTGLLAHSKLVARAALKCIRSCSHKIMRALCGPIVEHLGS